MADNLLEHIGDLPQVINQKDTDFFEIEGTDGANNPTSNKESRLQLKNDIATSGPVRDMAEDKAAAAAGIHDFENARFYRKGAIILRTGDLYRAKAAFTSGTGFVANDWELIPAGRWGGLHGDIHDQTDLAAILDDLQDAVAVLPNKANIITHQQKSPLSQVVIGSVLGRVDFDTSSSPGAPAVAGNIILNDGSRFEVDSAGNMSYTAADMTVTPIYTGGVWQASSIDTGTAAVAGFSNTSGGAWEAGSWVSGEIKIDLPEVYAVADDAEGKATSALAGLATEITRAQTEEAKKLNKNAVHANGSTAINNDDANNGLSATTTQTDTGTSFGIETNSAAGNPVIGGLVGRTAASPATGSRRLLFVTDSGGNIRVHLRKDKAVPSAPADLSENDTILNKGEIEAIVNDIMAALSQGLKTPAVISKESDLPDASTVENGTYYVVQELDETAPGQQGRAWKNDALSATDWQVVIDNVFAPDEEWIALNVDGELTIHEDIQARINGALQSSQVEQTLPESDSQEDEGKLISRRAAFGLLPKQQSAADAGKAMVIDPSGKLVPGYSGKVDTVDGVGVVPEQIRKSFGSWAVGENLRNRRIYVDQTIDPTVPFDDFTLRVNGDLTIDQDTGAVELAAYIKKADSTEESILLLANNVYQQAFFDFPDDQDYIISEIPSNPNGPITGLSYLEEDYSNKNVELSVEMTQAEYEALEDPPGSGLYPSLAGKTVTLKDVYPENTRRIPRPDYANMESTNRISTNNGAWTADRTGYIKVTLSSLRTGQDHVVVQINGENVISQQLNGTTNVYAPDINAILPISKGDLIRLNVQNYFNGVECYFIPIKWVDVEE